MFTWTINTKKERSSSWYMIAMVLSIALIIWGYITGFYMMSIVVILGIGVYALIENNSPESVQIEINENGVSLGDEFYDYPKIDSFSIIYLKKEPYSIRFKLNTRGFKIIDVPLVGGPQAIELRTFLLNFINEDAKGEISTLDSLTSYLKL